MFNTRIFAFILGCTLSYSTLLFAAEPTEKKTPAPKPGFHDVQAREASLLLKLHKKQLMILDIRTDEEFLEGHIKRAKHIDFFKDDFKTRLEKLDRKKAYLVHCASGGRSGRSMTLFKELGFESIYHMDDGYKGWVREKLPTVKGPEPKTNP